MNALNKPTGSAQAQVLDLEPLDTLYDASMGTELPLPPELARFYGPLRFPLRPAQPYIIANMVTSLDGVVSLGIEGKAGGKEISGSSTQDRALMSLLRAAADVVVVGAGTLRESQGRPLNAPTVFPLLEQQWSQFRKAMGKEGEPLAVIVTASGELDPSLPIFKAGAPALVVTTPRGARQADKSGLRRVALVTEVTANDLDKEAAIPAGAVLDAIKSVRDASVVLIEGGPHLLGDFFAAGLINEQFLTLSPQMVGRDDSPERLPLVEGHTFAPDHPLWGRLSVVKRDQSHLFLRYLFGGAA
jgi:riboflavin biosynthesis pyrimidine reductase